MKHHQLLVVAAAVSALSLPVLAGVSAQEAAEIGKTLTAMGAVKAGNAEGTIPVYAGGMTKPPAGWTKDGPWIDPYKDEKPVLKIDASNVDKHASKLTEGLIALIKSKPGFYINVFKTHRDYAFPKFVEEGTVKNASNAACKTFNGGDSLDKACRGGYPFPIPKTGKEAMWNKLANYQPPLRAWTTNYLIDALGNPIVTSVLETYRDNLNYFGGDARKDTDALFNVGASIVGPNRLSGSAQGFSDFLDPIGMPRKSWTYSPGQRRIRFAPEFSYDTPHATLGGGLVYDEVYLFSGAMDRFDFKIVGKKEAYIPSNNYPLTLGSDPEKCGVPKVMLKAFMDPECVRFELRRVWELEATLKPGSRHIYSKRKWLLDEDSWIVGAYDAWDQSGKLYRTGLGYAAQVYQPEWVSPYAPSFSVYDLQKNLYTYITAPNKPTRFGNPMKEIDTQPEAFATRSAR